MNGEGEKRERGQRNRDGGIMRPIDLPRGTRPVCLTRADRYARNCITRALRADTVAAALFDRVSESASFADWVCLEVMRPVE